MKKSSEPKQDRGQAFPNGRNEAKDLQRAWSQAASNTVAPRPLVVLKEEPEKNDPRHKAKEFTLKWTHGLLTLVFFCLLLGQIAGLYFFTKGFLLTKLVLDFKSECAVPPAQLDGWSPGDPVSGCWHPKLFEKAVVIVIDALRYDFTIPVEVEKPAPFQNALTVLYETAAEHPTHAFLLPFIADPPTTTLQRLKGLTTGTLPTFIDAGSNFAGTEVDEDNLVAQLRTAGKTLAHLGDDTWSSLFPGQFDPRVTHAYESFNVWDLHTLDEGVTEHLFPLLAPDNSSSWDVIFGHYLGVDHAGHRYGPSHPAMTAKLKQMDSLIRKMISSLDDSTLLVVMGDHGMDSKGDHGGESDDEIQAALWMYSKQPRFGRLSASALKPPQTAKERPVNQIDLVPTLSLLLGIPIPYNNLGAPILEAFITQTSRNWRNLGQVSRIVSAQVRRYQEKYMEARSMDGETMMFPQIAWNAALEAWSQISHKSTDAQWQTIYEKFADFQRVNLEVCKSLWARFDVWSMVQGILILVSITLSLSIYARCIDGDRTHMSFPLVFNVGRFAAYAETIIEVASWVWKSPFISSHKRFGQAFLPSIVWVREMVCFLRSWSLLVPTSLWGWLSILVTVSQAAGFAANSFTIWEDEILLFFINTIGLVCLVASVRHRSRSQRIHGMTQAFIFMFSTRLASLSRLCREEQMPYCKSTFYGTSSSSTSSRYLLFIPLITAYVLPKLIQSYCEMVGSWRGIASVALNLVFRIGLTLSAAFWLLDTATDSGQLPIPEVLSKDIRIMLARIILLGAIGPGILILFRKSEPCIAYLEDDNFTTSSEATSAADKNESKKNPIYIFGAHSARGAHYFLLLAFVSLITIFIQKPMGSGVMALLLAQILSLLELLSVNRLTSSSIGPITLALLGNFAFFKTGHQATLPSIQWEMAFVATRTVIYPFSPLFVVINTFGGQITTALAVPLVVLWRLGPKKREVLSEIAKALATFLLYHAVIALATTMWAYWLRRHLMLYRIFSPRFLTASIVLVIVDLVVVLGSLVAVRCNSIKIGRVFGLPLEREVPMPKFKWFSKILDRSRD